MRLRRAAHVMLTRNTSGLAGVAIIYQRIPLELQRPNIRSAERLSRLPRAHLPGEDCARGRYPRTSRGAREDVSSFHNGSLRESDLSVMLRSTLLDGSPKTQRSYRLGDVGRIFFI